MNHSPGILTVYKASAGSGKTFTLVSEYISLLVEDPLNNYKQILAVTFTNKATQEMKERILSQLYGIANGLSASNSYLEVVKRRTGMDEATVRSNASTALHRLTHEYNQFRVQTIDAFFQAILRNLGHELGLTSNLRVDLNSEQVEAKAVDELIEDLKENDEVLLWLDDYIQTNIDDNLSWNVIDKIKEFGKNIFKEYYKENEDCLNVLFQQKGFFPDFAKRLRAERDGYKKTIKEKSEFILNFMAASPYDGEYHQHIRGFLRRLYNEIDKFPAYPKYVAKLSESSDAWALKKSKNVAAIVSLVEENNIPALFKELVTYHEHNWYKYYSCRLVLKHLSKLRLLHKIAEKVNDDNLENHRFMLSDTQNLLKQLMKDEDIPFVYEKIGGMLKYIMIDEFQDTSKVQWDNFKKLLLNCLAEEDSRNLIVGDVKQSIYRWRQGDWEILNDIENAIKPDNGSFVDTSNIQITSLDTNRRSEENIIVFNNIFFQTIIKLLGKDVPSGEGMENSSNAEMTASQYERLSKAYADVVQKIPESRTTGKGYIKVKLFGKGPDYNEDIEDELKANILALLENGYQQKDIAILVRNKIEAQNIVAALSAVRYEGEPLSIVSEEAFRLDSSLAVNILIYALRLLTHPEDNLTRALLVKAYMQVPLEADCEAFVKRQGKTVSDIYVVDSSIERGARNDAVAAQLNNWLPSDFVGKRDDLLQMAMIDLVDYLYLKFGLKNLSQQNAYISTFYDVLNNYLRDNPVDIDDFLKEWEDNLSKTTIQSDEANGIRILTIHKSKGLEFTNVILPYCDWELEKTSGPKEVIKWFEGEGKEAPFNQLPLIPVDYKKELLNSVFAGDYRKEHFQTLVDNINLLYVAFTRAGKNLFLSGKNIGESKYQSKLLMESLKTISEENLLVCDYADDDNSSLSKSQWEKNNITEDTYQPVTFTFGALSPAAEEQKKVEDAFNPFSYKPKNKLITIETFEKSIEFRQSNKSDEFVRGEEMDDNVRYMKIGTVLHNIFSSIKTETDIPSKLRLLEEEGVVYNDELTTENLRDKIKQALLLPMVRDWFSDKWNVFNECTIMEYDEKEDRVLEHRPDRVIMNEEETIVIDYKFGKEHKVYSEQVKRYISLLEDMGYKNVKGFLWYVMGNKVVPVI